jgi:hypothetical protein
MELMRRFIERSLKNKFQQFKNEMPSLCKKRRAFFLQKIEWIKQCGKGGLGGSPPTSFAFIL